MRRRNFLVLTGAGGLVATLLSAVSPLPAAPAQWWLELLLKLKDLTDEVSDGVDWMLWSQDAVNAMQQGKAPPPSPETPSVFYERLQKQQERISALVVPSYEAILPDNGPVPTTSGDVTRGDIRSRVVVLREAGAEIQESAGVIKYFRALESSIASQVQRLYQLSQVLEELALKIPIFLITDTLLFQSLDVQFSYIPTAQETQAILERKRNEAEKRFAERRAVLQNSSIEIRNLLLVEAIDLRSEIERLRQLDEEVAMLQEKLADATTARRKAADKVDRRRAYVQAAELDVQDADDRLQDARVNVTQLETRAASVEADYNQPYVCPISGANWNDCKESSHQMYKDAYQARRRNLEAERNRLNRQLQDQKAEVNRFAAELQGFKDELEQKKEELREAREELELTDDRLHDAENELRVKVQFVTEEKWKSRADVFISDNENDQNANQTLINQLERGL